MKTAVEEEAMKAEEKARQVYEDVLEERMAEARRSSLVLEDAWMSQRLARNKPVLMYCMLRWKQVNIATLVRKWKDNADGISLWPEEKRGRDAATRTRLGT